MNLNEWEEDDAFDRLNMDSIYANYNFEQPASHQPVSFEKPPINLYRDRIINEIRMNSIVVLEGPTAVVKLHKCHNTFYKMRTIRSDTATLLLHSQGGSQPQVMRNVLLKNVDGHWAHYVATKLASMRKNI